MTSRIKRYSVIEHAFGSLGLVLIALICWAVKRQQSKAPADVVLGRLILACVSAIGWVVDRVPLPTLHRRDRAGRLAAQPKMPTLPITLTSGNQDRVRKDLSGASL